jgi:hypothetical protein
MNIGGNTAKALSNGEDVETSMIFLQEKNTIKTFTNNILILKFPLYRKVGSRFDFNGTFIGLSQKVVLEFHIMYRWINTEYPLRFNFQIMINNEVYINRNLGIGDELDINEFISSVIINLKTNDRIQLLFSTDFENDQMLEIIDNSYYTLRSF